MAWAALCVWVLVILFVGALVMWAAARESSSAFLSSLIPGSLAWQKKRRKAEETRRGKARIVGSFKIPPSSRPSSPSPAGRRVLATSSSVIEVKSLKAPSSPPLPKREEDPPLPKA
ncbi:MAG: hypothetical protein IKS61_00315 [Aeriscardovia sp.]|nr:hypothetical protein [Aeriscardovia sp.]